MKQNFVQSKKANFYLRIGISPGPICSFFLLVYFKKKNKHIIVALSLFAYLPEKKSNTKVTTCDA